MIDDLFTINPNSGNVDITGDVFGIDKIKTSRDGKAFLMFGVGRDYKTAISVKLIENDAIDADKIASLKNGMRIHILGYASLDKFSGQTFVRVDDFDIVPPPPNYNRRYVHNNWRTQHSQYSRHVRKTPVYRNDNRRGSR